MRWGQDKIRVSTIGDPEDSEEVMIAKFSRFIENYTPQLVSWNGGVSTCPYLHYRALIHGISAARYWDMGDGDFWRPVATLSGTTTSAATTPAIAT